MVLINEKKYACATCIKGHRVSGCTHTDRPLFEVKKKGRPATQCQFCREKRKGGGGCGTVHTKCTCGDLKNQQPSTIPAGMAQLSIQSSTQTPPSRATETKKGQPGATPTFPNGLRDVHEMAAAAEALADLGGESNAAAERNLQNLLNPCNCRTTGRCRCCAPKRTRSPPPSHSPRRTSDAHAQVTDSLIEMFKAKATTSTAPPAPGVKSPSNDGHSGSSTPTSMRGLQHLSMTATLPSPDNRHHPAHTSPFVHKVKLFSPYSNGSSSPRHGKPRSESVSSASSNWPSSSASPRPPPSRLRPLTDMNKFLGAVFHEDGSVVSEIPRSALGLPGIHTFVAAAQNGGVKVEPMEMDVDVPVAFPTSEEVVIGACTCGEGCQCAGCATHGNPRSASSSSPPAQHPHGHEGACGDACKSCFNCGEQVSIPSGVASIEQLIQIAAAAVPQPPRRGPTLDALDTRVLPPAAHMSEDVARAFGVVQLKPLECCNGRCQCSPGECKCDSECCGCCTECKCDDDGDTVMVDDNATPGEKQAPKGGCCGSAPPATPSRGSQQLQVICPSSSSGQVSLSTTPISPTAPGYATPPNGTVGPSVRRNSSVSRAKEGASGGARRLSTSSTSSQASVHRSTSSGSKPTSKSLAINHNHNLGPHHRPILPKPVSAGNAATLPRLVPPRATSGNRQRSRASSMASSQSSPSLAPVPLPVPPTVSVSDSDVPPPAEATLTAPNQPPEPSDNHPNDMAIGVDDIASALAASDVDFMTYINNLLSSAEGEQSAAFDVGQQGQQSGQGGAPLDPNPLNAISGATPRAAELEPSLGGIQELIAGALAQQRVLGSPTVPKVTPQPESSATSHLDFNYFFQMPTSEHPDLSREEQMANYQLNSNLGGMPMPQFAGGGVDPLQFDSNFFFNEYGTGDLSLRVPNLPTTESGPSSGEVAPQLQVQPPPQTRIPTISPAPSAPAPPPVQSTATPGGPDIIDLSKPLNSSDIDRIMQALLNQQARQGGSSVPAQPEPPQPQPHVPAHLPRSNAGSLSEPTTDPFQQYIVDPDSPLQQQQSHQPQQQQRHPQPNTLPQQLPQQSNGEWLQPPWPNMLGQAVPPK